jgi:putative transposase
VAEVSGIRVLRTPYKAPKANALCERFIGSVRRECLDHILKLSERHLHSVIKEYVRYYNSARPHQGIGQGIPQALLVADGTCGAEAKVISLPVLRGLHHDYRKAA